MSCSDESTEDAVRTAQSPEVFCPDQWFELTTNPGQGYNAVGYLTNGCTGFIIGPNHIAAAAHCLADPGTGSWQTPLRFYPNFHPSRLGSPPHDHVPRADVTRAVVGSRMTSYEGGNDWGIGYVTNWADTAGIDPTPIPLQDYSYVGLALAHPGYPRNWFDASGTLGDMIPDWWNCNPAVWIAPMGTPPWGEGTWCNERWQRGQVRYNVTHQRHRDDFRGRGRQARLRSGGYQWQVDGRSRTRQRRAGAWPQRSGRA